MSRRIVDIAADPLQYDRGEVKWATEGDKRNPNRQLFLEYLQPLLAMMEGKRVLDIGCGQGWLCDEVAHHGGVPLGLEPSARNLQMACSIYPTLGFTKTSLQDFKTVEQFDLAFTVMVENFLDLDAALKKVARLLKPGGKFITIISDYDRSTHEHTGYRFEAEALRPDETAIRIDFGERAGIICDIVRSVDRYEQLAAQANLTLRQHTPILPKPWHPRYETHKGRPLFHLLEFAR